MATTTLNTGPADYLRVSDLSPHELAHLLELAAEMKKAPDGWSTSLAGETVACFFEKPSTRTRVSFAAAAYRLGAQALFLRPDELQLGRGEPISDTARVLSSYTAAIVLRTFAQAEIEEVAAWADAPVVNALSDTDHPCQALADLLTMRERFGSTAGRTIVFLGDGANNVAHSLVEACVLSAMRIVVCGPAGYQPSEEFLDAAADLARRGGGEVDVTDDPCSAVAGADAVYTDVWVSMGEEAEAERRDSDLDRYRVTADLMALAREDAIFLHCLPAHRGAEVAAEVIDGAQSAVWQQAANRLPTEQALLLALTRSGFSNGITSQ